MGRRDGWSHAWYPNGQLREQRLYSAGIKSGRHSGFWENGRPAFRFDFESGAYHGTCFEWYASGRLAAIRNFSSGSEDGQQKSWTDQGKLFANYYMVAGRRYGLIGARVCSTVATKVVP